MIEDFKACNTDALASYSGERAARYTSLKLSGLAEAPGHLAVFADKASDIGHGLGRTTMPETIEYSVVAAICSMWLAARAEGFGLGWVSILKPGPHPRDPRRAGILAISDTSASGTPTAEFDRPELERANWEYRRAPKEFTIRR